MTDATNFLDFRSLDSTHSFYLSVVSHFYEQKIILALATAAQNGVVGACVEALAAGEDIEQRFEVSSCLEIPSSLQKRPRVRFFLIV